ncbi:MAG TPA: DUF3034 family protein [Gammaproteobacteria bacterium]|jgi:hypothetical protein
MRRLGPLSVTCAVLLSIGAAAHADDGRLLATGGLTEVEGSAGGGIVPWAVITGYGTGDQNGATAFLSHADTGDYTLSAVGMAVGIRDRVELSFADQDLDLGTLGTALKLPGTSLHQQIMGAKVRVIGDVVYGDWPEISLGVQYKHDLDFTIPQAVGAKHDSGTDLYTAATKVFVGGFFDRDLVVNFTLRGTKANQLGLLGFGGDKNDSYKLEPEASLGVLLDEHTAVGLEYRQKPDNLSFAKEDAWSDFFIAYFPSKSISLVAAYAVLGDVATLKQQRGLYLSVQAAF